jgi:hypothetical protein
MSTFFCPHSSTGQSQSTPTWVRYKADDYEFINCAATGFPGADVDHYSSRKLREGKEPAEETVTVEEMDPIDAMYGPLPVEYDWNNEDERPF